MLEGHQNCAQETAAHLKGGGHRLVAKIAKPDAHAGWQGMEDSAVHLDRPARLLLHIASLK